VETEVRTKGATLAFFLLYIIINMMDTFLQIPLFHLSRCLLPHNVEEDLFNKKKRVYNAIGPLVVQSSVLLGPSRCALFSFLFE
jgi:hypothetical protein